MKDFEAKNLGNGMFCVKIDGVELKGQYSLQELGSVYASHLEEDKEGE